MASAAAQRVVVADPAREFHRDVELADDLGEQFAVVAAAERGVEVDQVDPLGAVALPVHRGVERRAVLGLAAGLALHEADGPALHDVDSRNRINLTAVNLEPLNPIAQKRGAGVAALLRVKLGGGQRTVLDGGQERHVCAWPTSAPHPALPSHCCAA